MWWQKPYINRRDWILENLGSLKLSTDQVVVILMIDYMNQNGLPITPADLSLRTAIEESRLDEVLHNLTKQGILEIAPRKNEIGFSLDSLFRDGIRYEYVNQNIFEVFESEMGRTLSQLELEQLNTWLSKYTQEEIISALRTAIVYQKIKMPYINTILANNRKEQ